MAVLQTARGKVNDFAVVHSGVASRCLKRRRPYHYQDDEEILENQSKKKSKLDDTGSPLLRLPAEIRRLIFCYVLGGNYIHVEQLPAGHAHRYAKKGIEFGQGIWNELCTEAPSESAAYRSFLSAEMGSEARPTPFGKSACGEDVGHGYHVDSWTYRHYECAKEPELRRFNVAVDEWSQREYLSTGCLRVCKLIHREMRLLPYSENVFMFRSPVTLQAFAASIRPERWRAMRHLSLPIAIGSAPFSEGRSKLWTSILWDYRLAGTIRRLKTLDLTLELYFPREAFDEGAHTRKPRIEDCVSDIAASSKKVVNVSRNWIQEFARLSAHNPDFRVIVVDDPLSMWGVIGKISAMRDWTVREDGWMRERSMKCLTVEQKQNIARELEQRLRAEATSREER